MRFRKEICCFLLLVVLVTGFSLAATTGLHIVRYGSDGTTILQETTVPHQWLEENLPVQGDGLTHYYHQGPVFLDHPDPVQQALLRWNPGEDTNVREKDMGAVKGTDLRDICELVGGMTPEDIVRVRAADGFMKEFAYRNVYTPQPRQGPLVVTWYKADEGYVPGYRDGMRLVFFADTSTNPWGIHAFGAWDWHESAGEQYWYYYRQGDQGYPTTTGLSVMQVSEIHIIPADPATPAPGPDEGITIPPTRSPLPVLLFPLSIAGGLAIMARRRRSG